MVDNMTNESLFLDEGIVMPPTSEAKWFELINVLTTMISNYANQKLQEGVKLNEQIK